MKIRIGLIGANGYIGLEIIRLIKMHPNIEIKYIFKHKKNIIDEFNHLKNFNIDEYQTSDISKLEKCDCVFLCLPHGESQMYVKTLIGKTKIIDLGSDNRLNDKDLYNQYYSGTFDANIQSRFTYGFIEKNKSIIEKSENISNPGCFALCAQLSILPIFEKIKNIDIFAITGSSGGGKEPKLSNHHSTRSKDIFSYNINNHRHLGEIIQSFPNLNLNNLSFVPTSGPFIRGIFLNCFIELNNTLDQDNFNSDFLQIFKNKKFLRNQVNIKLSNVIGSNYCDISYTKLSNNKILIQSCLDNLIKGAAGNAIQCMNIIFKLDEDTGLSNLLPIYV